MSFYALCLSIIFPEIGKSCRKCPRIIGFELVDNRKIRYAIRQPRYQPSPVACSASVDLRSSSTSPHDGTKSSILDFRFTLDLPCRNPGSGVSARVKISSLKSMIWSKREGWWILIRLEDGFFPGNNPSTCGIKYPAALVWCDLVLIWCGLVQRLIQSWQVFRTSSCTGPQGYSKLTRSSGHAPPLGCSYMYAPRKSTTAGPYRGTSLMRNRLPVGPYSRTMPRVLWWSWGGGQFLMSEVPL
ncbi:hypothetical protein T484DRAFT_3365307 [Baffinella frigidus]|nr:hypothetical protein T484DRAFT_3365307 [Cryptophyta sp. CCMP2293]